MPVACLCRSRLLLHGSRWIGYVARASERVCFRLRRPGAALARGAAGRAHAGVYGRYIWRLSARVPRGTSSRAVRYLAWSTACTCVVCGDGAHMGTRRGRLPLACARGGRPKASQPCSRCAPAACLLGSRPRALRRIALVCARGAENGCVIARARSECARRAYAPLGGARRLLSV